MSIGVCHKSIATVYDAQLSPPWLTPSRNGRGVVVWNLDTETLSLMLASPTLQGEVL